MKSLLWAWKGQLVKAKQEVDKAWQMVLEGLEVLGCIPGSRLTRKPFFVGRSKR
jgi:hypothetical protein